MSRLENILPRLQESAGFADEISNRLKLIEGNSLMENQGVIAMISGRFMSVSMYMASTGMLIIAAIFEFILLIPSILFSIGELMYGQEIEDTMVAQRGCNIAGNITGAVTSFVSIFFQFCPNPKGAMYSCGLIPRC